MSIFHLYAFLVIVAVLIFAYFYGRKTRKWRWSEYFLMAFAPLGGAIFLSYYEGPKVLVFFFWSAWIGTILELALGWLSEKTLGRKMWVYNYSKLSLGRYTSLLVMPFWGGAGLVFWLLAQLFGL